MSNFNGSYNFVPNKLVNPHEQNNILFEIPNKVFKITLKSFIFYLDVCLVLPFSDMLAANIHNRMLIQNGVTL
jgi:hypothetical protein